MIDLGFSISAFGVRLLIAGDTGKEHSKGCANGQKARDRAEADVLRRAWGVFPERAARLGNSAQVSSFFRKHLLLFASTYRINTQVPATAVVSQWLWDRLIPG